MLYHNSSGTKSNKKVETRKFVVVFIVLVVLVNAAIIGLRQLQADIPFEPVLVGEMQKWQIVEPAYKPDQAFFSDNSGGEQALSSLKGQWSVINLWASWCPPCLVELPGLVAAAKQHPSIRILALNMDAGITQQRLDDLVDHYGIATIAAVNEGQGPIRTVGRSLHKTFGIKGLPTTILLDPNGKMRGVYLGEADWNSADAHAFFNGL